MDGQPRRLKWPVRSLWRSWCAAVVAVGAPSAMPTRSYSPAILGGLWPNTDPDAWSDVAEALKETANELDESAASIRKAADGLRLNNCGEMIDGMHSMYVRDSQAVGDVAVKYDQMAEVVNDTARAIY